MSEKQPVVYIIGGPNGAGKTTAAMSIMPGVIECYEYVNADAIAAGLSPFRSSEVSIEAGRLMLRRIRELAKKREDFAFETTMASRSFAPFLRECRGSGYRIHCVYVWLRSADLSIARVADRVKSGGHFVPDATVRTRYARGLHNFFALYIPIADSWAVYDNSNDEISLVAEKTEDGLMHVRNPSIWESIAEAHP